MLFRLDPDRSHALARAALRWAPPWAMLAALSGMGAQDPRLRTRFAGLELPSPVGLAAGFDKDGDLVGALSCLGFGFITVGTVMPQPRSGNAFPRLVRYPASESLADAMGLPSRGRDHAVAQLERPRPRRVPILANVGGFSDPEIAEGVHALEAHVDASEISLLCPNLPPPGATFDELSLLRRVLERIEGHRKPVTIRVPNVTTTSDDRLAELIDRCAAAGVAGIKVGGGRPVAEPRLSTGSGTLHGRAIFEHALGNVERAARMARGRLDVKGNGGVSTAADVLAMQAAGATCVDLYSALVYRGWGVAHRINRELGQALNDGAGNGAVTPPQMTSAAARRSAPRARRAWERRPGRSRRG